MNIVVLDGNCVNPGDLSWDALSQFGEYKVYDRTAPNLVIERAKDADILVTNKVVIDKDIMDNLPNLKLICILATGYNTIDTDYAREKGIIVSNIPAYSTKAVAQLVFAYILKFAFNVEIHSKSVHNGDWVTCPDFCYQVTPLFELQNKTIGIIGYGSIGKQVAKIASAFDMKVLATSKSRTSGNDEYADFADIDTILANSDIVSIHTPLTPETTGMANAEFFAKMKNTAYFINTSRGPVVNEQDLRNALDNGVIAGAAVDVLSQEPCHPNNPLLGSSCLITPHIAWAPVETRQRLMDIFIENISAFIAGKPQNTV